jgi:O-antigen/teichoic acid export membrane protein
MEDIGRKIAHNTLIQLVSKGVTVVTSLAIVSLLTRYLGQSGYGMYATALNYGNVAMVFVDLGFFLIVLREISGKPELKGSLVSNAFTIKLVLGVLVFAASYFLTFLLPYDATLRHAILVASLSFFVMSLSQIVITVLQADLEMHKSAIADVAGRLVNLGLVILAISYRLGISEVLLTSFVGNLVLLSVNWYWVTRKIRLSLAFDFAVWKKLLHEALPMGIVLVLSTIYFRIDTLMLSTMKSLAEVGIYQAPYKVLEVILSFPTIFMSSVFPILVGKMALDLSGMRPLFRQAFDVLGVMSLPLIGGIMVFALPIMLFVAGPDFAASAPVLQILIWAVGGSFLNSVMIYSLIAAGHQKRLILPYLLTTAFNVTMNLLLIPRFSYIGAAYVTVATELLVLVYSGWLVAKLLKISPSWINFFKSLLAAGLMVAVLELTHVGLVLGMILGLTVYGLLIFWLKVIDKKTLSYLWLKRS